jgi:hypothetical protein
MNLRYGAASLGINIQAQVNQRLSEQFGELPSSQDLQDSTVSFGDLQIMTTLANTNRFELMKKLFDQKRIFGTRRAIYAVRLMRSQKLWTDLAVDQILYAAHKHGGDLAKVPFLEPKSITHAELVYPLAGKPPYFQEPGEA